jgi:hypothetical protein
MGVNFERNQGVNDPFVKSHGASGLSFPDSKFLASVPRIAEQKLVSGLQPECSVFASDGFVVASLAEAAHVVSSALLCCCSRSSANPCMAKAVGELDRTQGNCCISLPQEATRAKAPLNGCRSCFVQGVAEGLWTVRFGDGCSDARLYKLIGTPALIRGMRMDFSLKPIPSTNGAKAFSVSKLEQCLKESFGESASFAEGSDGRVLRIALGDGQIELSCHILTSLVEIHHAGDLMIFPGQDLPVPTQFQERLFLKATTHPLRSGYTLASASVWHDEVMQVARKISTVTIELFGHKSPNRIHSLAAE